ncbi:MAG: AraC family transcriptional regulator [Bacteroidetes bacterium]|nr:MAG: AraC family transcriptional regulator [Bacteroidota bacterium]RLD72695.1 MAG: AraC family transcriptional regulator [Bacteroidota bacterium]RLD95765.1 MAG: AraC family transcriptional regulator [Bacteroidota bacterium]RLE06489.1 MAG: AraC family transcriptional regulator [Bacteroidota bacterium]
MRLVIVIAGKLITTTIHIKNMISHCCIRVIKEELEAAGIGVDEIGLGKATISYDEQEISYDYIRTLLVDLGMDLIVTRDSRLVEQIKLAVVELIHYMNNVDSIVRKSEYLVEKTGLSYSYLSRIFSSQEHITLEKFIILNKIERIKELIDQEELTLSEIAFRMDYNSVQYLSSQFKQSTGLTVSEYRESDRSSKKPIDQLY